MIPPIDPFDNETTRIERKFLLIPSSVTSFLLRYSDFRIIFLKDVRYFLLVNRILIYRSLSTTPIESISIAIRLFSASYINYYSVVSYCIVYNYYIIIQQKSNLYALPS
jgi:hypothetical protein